MSTNNSEATFLALNRKDARGDNKFCNFIKERGQKYKFSRKNVIINPWIGLIFWIWTIVYWIVVTIWVIYNGRHLGKNSHFESTLRLKLHGSIFPNFSEDDFNVNYVKPEEYENYNRPWGTSDYMGNFPNEKHVMTNMAITKQTEDVCPQSALSHNVLCDPNNDLCEKGVKTSHGVQTGNCVAADFPYLDPNGVRHYNVSTCEIKGKI
jgi:hypothetical protein